MIRFISLKCILSQGVSWYLKHLNSVAGTSATDSISAPLLQHLNDSSDKSVAGCQGCSLNPDVDLPEKPQSGREHGQKITSGVTMVIRSVLTDAH